MSATRREALAGGATAVALVGLPRAAAAAAPSDADSVGRLLGLERRLEAAYTEALARRSIDPALGRRLLGHEREHVRGLEQALSDLGRREPRATAPAPTTGIDFASERAFAASALQLERETVDAYRDALTDFHDDHLVQPLGSIMACGAQHEVALRRVLGDDLL